MIRLAIRDFSEAKKQQQKNKKLHISKVRVALAALIVAVFGITVFACVIPNYAAAAEYNKEAARIESQISELNQESEEIKNDLKNQDELFERIAREEYGYCKPGEKVFYGSSFGE